MHHPTRATRQHQSWGRAAGQLGVSGCATSLSLCVCVSVCIQDCKHMCIYLSLSKYVRMCLSLSRVQILHSCLCAADLSYLQVCVCLSSCTCVCVCVAKLLTSYKIPACQMRLLQQSAITPLTCSSWKPTLTVMDGANETSKCERRPKKRICASVRVMETFASALTTSLGLHVGVYITVKQH